MSVQVMYRDFRRSLSIEDYVEENAETIVRRYLPFHDDCQVEVVVQEDKHRNQEGKRPHFVCEVRVKIDGFKQVYKVKKSDYNFYASVNKAGEAIRKIMERHHARRVSGRRVSRLVISEMNFNPAVVPDLGLNLSSSFA